MLSIGDETVTSIPVYKPTREDGLAFSPSDAPSDK